MNRHNEPSRKILSRFAAAIALLIFSAGVALAQAPQSAPAQDGGMDHGAMGHDMKGMGGMGSTGGMGGGMMRQMLCAVTEHVEGRLAYLKAELKLTDQQQAAWNTFADAYRATTGKTAKVCATMDAAGADHSMHKGVLGHLTMMEHHMSDHLDSVRGLKGALEPLFAVMTEDQKKAADQALMTVMDVGMGKMMGH
jgi:LTXXQ motif family protein